MTKTTKAKTGDKKTPVANQVIKTPVVKPEIKTAATTTPLKDVKPVGPKIIADRNEFGDFFDNIMSEKPEIKLTVTAKGKQVSFVVSASLELGEVMREGIKKFDDI